MRAGADELRELARKYRVLVELRARRDAGGSGHASAVLRTLAREFPGCLRELDTLGAVELARRAEGAAAAAAGGEREAWMDWIFGYHRLMLAALDIRRGGRGTMRLMGVDDDDASVIDEAFIAAVKAPPAGRIGIVVLRRLASIHATPAKEIAVALFPLRRPSPYDL